MSDDLESYFEDLQNAVRTAAAVDGVFSRLAFTEAISRQLSEAEEVDELRPAHFEGTGQRNRKISLDGFDFGDEEGQVVLAVCDYSSGDEIESIAMSDAKKQFGALEAFVEATFDGSLISEREESTVAYQVALEMRLRKRSTDKIRLYLLTNRRLTGSVKEIDSKQIDGVAIEFHLWDIQRLQRVQSSQLGREEIDIDLTQWSPSGVPMLATPAAEGMKILVGVLPGEMLAGIYRKHGGRVLEANVRSFLSVRGNVNKGIRGTIQQEPELFLAYNNGVTATAASIDSTIVDGVAHVTSVRDLQIVNGGQTTASLFYIEKNDKVELSGIYVPIKLIVVSEALSAEMVPKISRYANTQNRVSEADFFSNHPFHVRMEEKSRRLLTPARAGVSFQTKWFYERTRGQYLNEKSKLSIAQARKFETEYPRSQMITKTDAAKFETSWAQRPHVVSSGAQKNFLAFATQISTQWEANSDQFGDDYYRDLVAKGLLFSSVRTLVQKSDWYSSGYLANVVTYSIAKLSAMVSAQSHGSQFDFGQIWLAQSVPPDLLEAFRTISKSVFDVLTDENRPVVNVTEWAKREKCWIEISEVEIELSGALDGYIIDDVSAREAKLGARKEQRVDTGIDAQIKVMNLGSPYWVRLRDFGRSITSLSERELSILKTATGESGRLPSEAQAVVLMELSRRMESVGFVGR